MCVCRVNVCMCVCVCEYVGACTVHSLARYGSASTFLLMDQLYFCIVNLSKPTKGVLISPQKTHKKTLSSKMWIHRFVSYWGGKKRMNSHSKFIPGERRGEGRIYGIYPWTQHIFLFFLGGYTTWAGCKVTVFSGRTETCHCRANTSLLETTSS